MWDFISIPAFYQQKLECAWHPMNSNVHYCVQVELPCSKAVYISAVHLLGASNEKGCYLHALLWGFWNQLAWPCWKQHARLDGSLAFCGMIVFAINFSERVLLSRKRWPNPCKNWCQLWSNVDVALFMFSLQRVV